MKTAPDQPAPLTSRSSAQLDRAIHRISLRAQVAVLVSHNRRERALLAERELGCRPAATLGMQRWVRSRRSLSAGLSAGLSLRGVVWKSLLAEHGLLGWGALLKSLPPVDEQYWVESCNPNRLGVLFLGFVYSFFTFLENLAPAAAPVLANATPSLGPAQRRRHPLLPAGTTLAQQAPSTKSCWDKLLMAYRNS